MTCEDKSTNGSEGPVSPERRRFLARLSLALSAFMGAIVSIPVISFLLIPFFRKVSQKWRDVGPLEKFPVGQTIEVVFTDPNPLPWAGVTAKTGAWVRRKGELEFTVFRMNCTHLGCPVRWIPEADLFMCPCHGGVYYADGEVAAGPPPHRLFQYAVRVRKGRVEVQTAPIAIT